MIIYYFVLHYFTVIHILYIYYNILLFCQLNAYLIGQI